MIKQLFSLFLFLLLPKLGFSEPTSCSQGKIALFLEVQKQQNSSSQLLEEELTKNLLSSSCLQLINNFNLPHQYKLETQIDSYQVVWNLYRSDSSLLKSGIENYGSSQEALAIVDGIANEIYLSLFGINPSFEKKILFVRQEREKKSYTQNLYLSRLNGNREIRINPAEEFVSSPSLSPDNRLLSYLSKSSRDPLKFVLLDLKTSKKATLTLPEGSASSPLRFSPSCERAAYTMAKDDGFYPLVVSMQDLSSRFLNLPFAKNFSPLFLSNQEILLHSYNEGKKLHSIYKYKWNIYDSNYEMFSSTLGNFMAHELSPSERKLSMINRVSSTKNLLVIRDLELNKERSYHDFKDIDSASWRSEDTLLLVIPTASQKNFFLYNIENRNWIQLNRFKLTKSPLTPQENSSNSKASCHLPGQT